MVKTKSSEISALLGYLNLHTHSQLYIRALQVHSLPRTETDRVLSGEATVSLGEPFGSHAKFCKVSKRRAKGTYAL